MKHRGFGFDNLKALLILLVVLGHVLECCPDWGGWNTDLYRLIYSFHMPAFLFVSGWFARYRPRKLVFHLLYLYLLFQLLYQLFAHFVLGSTASIQFTTPVWLLWYLLALVMYHLLLPLLDAGNSRKRWLALGVCVLISLLSGFDESIGYYLSLGRAFSYLPFFAAGHYVGAHFQEGLPKPKRATALLLTAAVVAVSFWFWRYCAIPKSVFWGSYSYADTGYGLWTELQLLAVAALWLVFFLRVVVPLLDRPIPLITGLGKRTLPVFLLHGFVIQLIKHYGWMSAASPLLALAVTAALLVVLGNPVTAKLFHWIFTGWWLEKLWKKV